MEISAKINNVAAVKKWVESEFARSEKAMNTAIKVEGYRLRKELKKDVKSGSPGASSLAPLSYIARRLYGKRPNRAPLERLNLGIRYEVTDKNPFEMAVGWVGGGTKNRTWRKLATMHQAGFTTAITRAKRLEIVRRGGTLGTVEGGGTPFFLRKSTTTFTTPARPIVDPFWRANVMAAKRNINQNFKDKMKGLKI